MILDWLLDKFLPKPTHNHRAAHLEAAQGHPLLTRVFAPDLLNVEPAPLSLHDGMVCAETYDVTC